MQFEFRNRDYYLCFAVGPVTNDIFSTVLLLGM